MADANYPTLGGVEAGYKYEFRPDGVYLTIYPVEDELLFELSDMRQILRDYGVLDYDVALLARTVREASGQPQKIAAPVEVTEEEIAKFNQASAPLVSDELEEYATIVVEVSRDKMRASVKFDTKYGAKLPTAEMVMDALKEKGIVYGIDEEAIEEGVKHFSIFIAAEGDPAVPGENAYIDRKFNLGVKGRPVMDEYDRVDYKNLNLFVLVKANDTLAIRIPQTKGTPGKDIYGDVVPAQNGRPIPMPNGKNTIVLGENQLIAAIAGQIVDTGTKISVDPQLYIKSSVGVKTGNIDFDGGVTISGDVKQGFSVKATGDVEIKGSVNGGEVEGRNVIIGGGVTGANRCKVQAQLDVKDIYIADVALHSTLRAGKRIVVEGKHGQIMGGLAVSGEEVQAKVIGNEAYVITRVSVGVDPNLQREYHNVCKSYKEGKKKLLHITQTLNTLSKIDMSKIPQERLNQLNALTRSQFPIAGQLKRDEKRILELEALLGDMKHGRVRVDDVLYPGVRLSINSVAKSVHEEYRHCTMILEDGQIVLGQY